MARITIASMIDVDKLKGKIIEKKFNIETLAQKVGINKATFYRRLDAGGEDFTVKEIYLIATELKLSRMEVNNIFFKTFVA
ncbi:MAG: XRE family transcriptional regulator [Acidaminococcaceae bacterium]